MNSQIARSLVIIGVALASGCGGIAETGGGSETGFADCSLDTECNAGESCLEGTCVSDHASHFIAGELSERVAQPPEDSDSEPAGNEAHSVPVGEPTGTAPPPDLCADAVPLSGLGVVWVAEWSPTGVDLATPSCGYPDRPSHGPALIGRWVAPYSGRFKLIARSPDLFNMVVGGASECGAPTGCSWLSMPVEESGGGWSSQVEEGEEHFITFQSLDDPPAPEGGTVIVSISPWP
jgi:hypothetical protein